MDVTDLEVIQEPQEGEESKGDTFMPVTEKITKEEFDELPRDATFNFGFNRNNEGWSAQLMIRGERVQIAIEADRDLTQGVSGEFLSLFRVEDGGRKLVYPQDKLKEPDRISKDAERSNSYHIDDLGPRETGVSKSKIKRLGEEEAANMITVVDGDSIIFYTGAGVSMGGEKPVWGMNQLKEKLGLNEGGEEFSRHFANPKDYPPQELLDKVDEFREQLYEDESSPAHAAISEVIRIKEGSIVLTENIDLKHEAEGSRVAPVHMDSDKEAFGKVRLRASNAKVLVTAGLGYDDRAIIQYLKQKNPELKIIAFTLSNDTIPGYLDENDVVVLGDVQETLPRVTEHLKKGSEK